MVANEGEVSKEQNQGENSSPGSLAACIFVSHTQKQVQYDFWIWPSDEKPC